MLANLAFPLVIIVSHSSLAFCIFLQWRAWSKGKRYQYSTNVTQTTVNIFKSTVTQWTSSKQHCLPLFLPKSALWYKMDLHFLQTLQWQEPKDKVKSNTSLPQLLSVTFKPTYVLQHPASCSPEIEQRLHAALLTPYLILSNKKHREVKWDQHMDITATELEPKPLQPLLKSTRLLR